MSLQCIIFDQVKHIVESIDASPVSRRTDFFISAALRVNSSNSSISRSELLESLIEQWYNEHSQGTDLVNGLVSYPTGQDISEVYWRSLLLDNDSEQPGERVENLRKVYTELFLRWIKLKLFSDIKRPRIGWDSVIRASAISSVICLLSHKISGPIRLFRLKRAFAWIVLWPTTTFFSHVILVVSESLCRQHRLQQMAPELQDLIQTIDSRRYNSVESGVRGRQFIVTKRGYVGWASPDTFINDELCFFQGSRIPFAIRRKNRGAKDKRGCYRLHGDCYVHGLMNGGATNFPDLEMRKIQLI